MKLFLHGLKYYRNNFSPEELKLLTHGVILTPIPQPNNPYDENAIALLFKGKQLGWIPKGPYANKQVVGWLQSGKQVACKVIYHNPSAPSPDKQIKFEVYPEDLF
jgi:hypothetical protein